MSILDFQKPDKVIMIDSSDTYGLFEFRPLEPGYGITIGNALRRILLSSLEGYAISSIRIEGVEHEFSTVKGVIEDVTEIVLNLKQVRFKKKAEGTDEYEKIRIVISGKEQFLASEFTEVGSTFEVINGDMVICNLDPKVEFIAEITIAKGRGYIGAEENKVNAPIGTIFTDSIFTPIKNVKYWVENFRVEQKTDYEKLCIEISTDGSIIPKDALRESATILIHHFALFSDERITVELEPRVEPEDTIDEDTIHIRQLLKTKLVDLDLSVRALNCLKAADIETLGELVAMNRSDLLKFRNFGKKSLTELDELLTIKNLHFGMNVAKYKLDKD